MKGAVQAPASSLSISFTVSNARLLLIALICAAPAVLFFDGPIMHGVLAGVAAVGMAFISRTMRPGETQFFLSFARPAAGLAAIPAIWMLIQVVPLPFLAHPIWASAQTGIGHPIAGSISIDIGASVMALGFYLTIVAVAFWSAAVTVDRQRAEWILFSLMTATALIGVTVAAMKLYELSVPNSETSRFDVTGATDCVAMGVLIAAAATIRTRERYETRLANQGQSISRLLWTFAACAFALAICVAVLAIEAPAGALVATGYGVLALASVVLIRRFGLRAWGMVAIAMPAIAFAGFLAATTGELRTRSVSLAFTTATPASLTSMSQRILDDAPMTGTGAGTFAAIAPMYREIDDQAARLTAPTTAVAIAIELSRPALWFVVATMAGSTFILFRAALRRGRDSFYPAAGASCLITLLFLCFMNAGVLGSAVASIAAAMLGLAFAQSKSRTVQQ